MLALVEVSVCLKDTVEGMPGNPDNGALAALAAGNTLIAIRKSPLR
jgi:hypothetical protein